MRVAGLFGPVFLLLLCSAAAATPIHVNGYKPVERAVIVDRFDRRGGSLAIAEGNLTGSDLRSAEVVAVADDILTDSSRRPANGLGEAWWLDVQATAAGSAQFVAANTVSVSHDDTTITIREALSRFWFGRPGGDRLEAVPSSSITPSTNPQDGNASTASLPASHSVVDPERVAATLIGVALAVIGVWQANRRRESR